MLHLAFQTHELDNEVDLIIDVTILADAGCKRLFVSYTSDVQKNLADLIRPSKSIKIFALILVNLANRCLSQTSLQLQIRKMWETDRSCGF